MLVRCPQCKTEFRLVDIQPGQRVVKYLCPGCRQIVRIDQEKDEVAHSSSSGSFRAIERAKTILVADDTEETQALIEKVLGEAGYTVIAASNGYETLELVREAHPDLVILDLLMPKLTGFDVLREIRQDERIRDTRVLAMSGVYKDNVIEFLHQLGAEGFLPKERIEETLLFRVEQILETRSAT